MTWNFILYLLYGLSFFTLGVAILSRDIRLSELGIAKILWLLALFGISHGFHEWLELLEQLNYGSPFSLFFTFRLLLVSFSFLCLLYFGIFLFFISLYGDHSLKTTSWITKGGIATFVSGVIFLALHLDINGGLDFHTRRFIAFPGGLLSGIGLILYSRTVRKVSQKGSTNFIFAGIFMISYAFFSGVVPSDYVIAFVNIEIIVLRGICAFFITFFTIRALSVFSIEQRKLIDEKLQRFAQSEKLTSMGILAAGIAHEINNPLTNASLNLEMLRDLVQGDEKVDKKLDSIDRNIERASSIAQELLHFSREKVTPLEPVNLNEVIQSSYNLVKNRKFTSQVKLNLGKIPNIMGIPYKLEEVFINLLMNSIDACEEGDIIEVETYRHEKEVIVEITDTGHGVHPGHISQVFDPFFTTKEIGKGTGLGLSVCYNIIKQHNGDITLVSSEHGGAVMTIRLPMVRENG